MKKIMIILIFFLIRTELRSQNYIDNKMQPKHYIKAGCSVVPTLSFDGQQLNGKSSGGPYFLKYEINVSYNLTIGITYFNFSKNGVDTTENESYDFNTSQWTYTKQAYTWKYSGSGILIHSTYLVIPDKKLQPYFSLGIGTGSQQYTSGLSSTGGPVNSVFGHADDHLMAIQFVFGINYLWSDGFGAYAEAGFGKSLVTMGLVKCFGKNL